MAQKGSTSALISDELTAMYLESEEMFRVYMKSLSPSVSGRTTPTMSSNNNDNADNNSIRTICEKYKIRTISEHNMARLSILPILPPDSLLSPLVSTTTTTDTSLETPRLLLTNVWIEHLTDEHYERVTRPAYIPLFKLQMDTNARKNPETFQTCLQNSYMWNFYRKLYSDMKKQMKVSMSIIDFNLNRFQQCVDKVIVQRGYDQTMLSFNEIPLAFEFYMQIDVDMFFLKTCSFNNVEPRFLDNRLHEGLFCMNEPEARFAISPCNKRHCLCCHSPCPRRDLTDLQQNSVIPFSNPHIHQFVNGYQAILNCPATCETKNCIYVLTCPCGQFDFVSQTPLSFAATLTYHREEGNRIIREFLIGESNVEHLTNGRKSAEKCANNKSWLYQHSARCSIAMQIFLDENPDYWCFVPMQLMGINLVNTDFRRSLSRRTSENETYFETIEQPIWARDAKEVHFLMENVPKPPIGFAFSMEQRQEQAQFFKCARDRIVPRDHPDLYNANIIAVLPDQSSELLRVFIESLFVTHAECKLNEIGNLVYEERIPNIPLSKAWCADLTRRHNS